MAAVPQSDFAMAQQSFAPKIQAFAIQNRNLIPTFDVDDLVSEVTEMLWIATRTYDPNRGAKFSTHFWNLAKRRMIDLHRTAARKKRVLDYSRIVLDPDAMREVVEETLRHPSAEEEALARMEVRLQIRAGRKPR